MRSNLGSDFELILGSEEEKDPDVRKAVQVGVTYLYYLLPDPETGLVAAEETELSSELRSFIAANKDAHFKERIYDMDHALYVAYKMQKVANDYLLNKRSAEGSRARLLDNIASLQSSSREVDFSGNRELEGSVIREKLKPDEILRLLILLESLEKNDFAMKVNGIKLVITKLTRGMNVNPLPLQFLCHTDGPVKISVNLCKLDFKRKSVWAEFRNEFRRDLFHSFLNSRPDKETVMKFFLSMFSDIEKEGRDRMKSPPEGGNRGQRKIIKLRISIRGISPPIWRKLLVSSETTLHDLHLMIQAAFGWYNYHLYEFSYQGLNFSRPDDWDEPASEDMDSTKITLDDLNLQRGTKFLYTYDFGDNWEHIILVQDILDYDPQMSIPACIGGKRNAPPEDCGGVWGYYNVLRIAKDPNDPEHNETVEWLGEYDPESFDIDSANHAVRNYREMDGTF